MRRRSRGLLLAALAGLALSAQASRGSLSYSSGAKRVVLRVIDGNHPAFLALRPEEGESGVVREFFLTHSGPEKMIAPNANPLKASAPAAWKVGKHRGSKLLQADEATYWSYTPGLVLPASFQLGRDLWKLEAAELPPLMFVELR